MSHPQDDELLLRLFRLLYESERTEVLRHIAEKVAARVSVEPTFSSESEHANAILKSELENNLSSWLRPSMPSQELWDYLGDWIDDTISYAWGDETASVIFGSSAFDRVHADQLLHEVNEMAANQHLPEPPPFEVAHTLSFIQQWRDNAVRALEQNAVKGAKIVMADVVYTNSDETLYPSHGRTHQLQYLAESLDSTIEMLEADGWSRAGQIGRSDGVTVALWTRNSREYLAVWDSEAQPLQQGDSE